MATLHIGNHVQIGGRSILWAVHSKIIIADKVVCGPEIVIMAGDHNIGLRGKFMIDLGDSEKLPKDDKDVVVEEDVWIGSRVVVLKGVTIGRGSVIGAGSVVTKSVPPYCIAAGNPARLLRRRGSVAEILEHENALYSPEKRLSPATLNVVLHLSTPAAQ